MLTVPTRKVAQVVLMGHELTRAEPELRAFIERMPDEEQAELVALMWIGRGAFEADEFEEARATALREATTPTVDYLLGSPHISDNLEAGLEALGISLSDDEEDLMRGA